MQLDSTGWQPISLEWVSKWFGAPTIGIFAEVVGAPIRIQSVTVSPNTLSLPLGIMPPMLFHNATLSTGRDEVRCP